MLTVSHHSRHPHHRRPVLALAAAVGRGHYVVLLTNARVKVPYGSYADALVTAEWTPLEPDVLSEKAYAKGVGEIREADVSGGDERFDLVMMTTH